MSQTWSQNCCWNYGEAGDLLQVRFWSWLEVSLVLLMVILAITGESLQEKAGQQVGRSPKHKIRTTDLSIFGFDFWVRWANQVSFVVYIFELDLITGTIRKPNYYRSFKPLMKITIFFAMLLSTFQLQETCTLLCQDCHSLTVLWTPSVQSRRTFSVAH